MSQAVNQVPSGSGLSVRQGINAALAALLSLNSGNAAPANPVPFMLWADTGAGEIRIRNAANTDWVLLSTFLGALEFDRVMSLSDIQKAQGRDNLGLGSAATRSIGNTGSSIPLLNAGNTWAATQYFAMPLGLNALQLDRTTSPGPTPGASGDVPRVRFVPYNGAESFVTHREIYQQQDFFLIAVKSGSAWGNFHFYANGSALAADGSWNNSSDGRLKPNFAAIPDPIASLRELTGGTWNRADNGTFGVGIKAQDAERAVPGSAIDTGDKDMPDGSVIKNALAIDTAGVGVAVLVEAVKVLLARVEALEAREV